MPVGIRLVDVSAAGYDKNGKAVYFTTKITAESANTNVTKKSSCDVNADGVVDLLDIAKNFIEWVKNLLIGTILNIAI